MFKIRDDRQFNLMFLKIVEKYDVLYNNIDRNCDRHAKDLAWVQVANEAKCSVEDCKKRFRCLRISLLRHLRESAKDGGGICYKKKKQFYLEKAMKFLIPYTKSRQPISIVESEEELSEGVSNDVLEYGEQKNSDEYCDVAFTSHLESGEDSINIVPSYASQITANSNFNKSGNRDENWEQLAVQCFKILSEKHKTESNREEDADLLFLKSLLPDVKKLNDTQKRQFKQKIFTLLDDVLKL